MISVYIQGGLGNQLFMIFTTLAHSIQYNIPVIFPLRNRSINRGTYWDTLFDNLQHLTKHTEDIYKFIPYHEPVFAYSSIPVLENHNICLVGYFQSFKYFHHLKESIFILLNLFNKKNEIKKKYCHFFDKETVCMHFRMGDYKTQRNFHPIMNYEYFEGALIHIMENSCIQTVLYLCEQEDNEYVNNDIYKLNHKYPHLTFVKIDDSITDYDQLLIMSCCDHNIMSNSSFSWWGAYLNENPNKLVTYPSIWMGKQFMDVSYNFEDMMMYNWTKIEANPIPDHLPL